MSQLVELDQACKPYIWMLCRLIHKDFRDKGNGQTRLAPNGEPYVTLTSGGIKVEGEDFPAWFSTPAGAMKAWQESFRRYAGSATGDIYWRERPSMVYSDAVLVGGGYNLWTRLLVVADEVIGCSDVTGY